MLETIGGLSALFYGAVLMWAGVNTARFLTMLVRPARPTHFVALHMTAVWGVGSAAALAGVYMVVQGLTILGQATGSQ